MRNPYIIYNGRMTAWWMALWTVACLATNAWSQENKPFVRPVPPAGVLLNAPPEFAQWSVTFLYPQDRPSRDDSKHLITLEESLMRKIIITRTKEIIHEESVSVTGAKFEKWQNSSKYYIKPQGQSYWGECDDKFAKDNQVSDSKLLPLPTDKFRDLEWVNAKTYAGSLKDQGKEYLLFVPDSSTRVDFSNAAEVKSQPIVAYVDAATRLPIAFKNKTVIQQYAFGNAPSEMQSFPADLAQEIKIGNERRAKVFIAPHKEY